MYTTSSPQNHQKRDKPTTDNDYFERMCRVIFTSGLNWKMVENKWPGINRAFVGFDIHKVATFLEPEIEEIMMNPDTIHNLAKIRGVVTNAKEFQAVVSEYGSFKNYLSKLQESGGEDGLLSGVAKRFSFMGKSTTMFFLFSAGEGLPKAHQEWMDRHKGKK